MRILIVTLLALLLFLTPAPTASAYNWTSVVKILRASTVPIECSGHQMPVCTAFSINEEQGIFLTAAHCTEPYIDDRGDPTEVAMLDGKPLTILYIDKIMDIAVIKAQLRKPALHPRTKLIEVGMEIGTFGYGYGFTDAPIFRSAILSAVMRDTETKFIFHMLDNSLVKGQSGGPAVDTEGRLVGVNLATDYFSGRVLSISSITKATSFWEFD